MSQWSAVSALDGRRLLVTGATGFLGKVALAMLLDRVPGVGKVFVMVRPKGGRSAAERLHGLLAESPVFAPLRRRHGDGFDAFIGSKVEAVSGDGALPGLGLSPEDRHRLGKIDLFLNIAGLVSLNPVLDEALAVNARGALYAGRFAAELGAALLHVSTAYVAEVRQGEVLEASPAAAGLDAAAELAAGEEAAAALRAKLKGGTRRGRRQLEERLVEAGRRRAREKGWPNAYCMSKALGEALLAGVPGLRYAVVRPAIVESAVAYPAPGWNEGMNTSAPVILAMSSGRVLCPIHRTAALDLIPVDYVAAGAWVAAAALLEGRGRGVYHLASSDTNPLPARLCMRFVTE